MLLVVGHPGIGAGLEALLRIEERYDTRRVQSLEQVRAGVDGWTADDLRRGIERALVRSRRGVPPRVALLVLLLLALAIIATLIVSVIARG